MSKKVKPIYFINKKSKQKTKYANIEQAEKELRKNGMKISATQISKFLNNQVRIEYPYTFMYVNDNISEVIELKTLEMSDEKIYSINNSEEIFKRFGRSHYLVGNYGNIYNLDYNAFLVPKLSSTGYLTARLRNLNGYSLCKRITKYVHRIVAEVFLPIPDKYKDIQINKLEVHHLDDNHKNNYVENLDVNGIINYSNYGR